MSETRPAAVETRPIDGDGLQHHMKEELIRTKSAVRVYMTVVAFSALVAILVYDAIWMNSGESRTALIGLGTILTGYWFGERSQTKRNQG